VLVDETHLVTRLYGMVNVPTAVWIDERGRIVRPNEVAFADDRFKPFHGLEAAPYLAAIRNWVSEGERSAFVLSEAELRARPGTRTTFWPTPSLPWGNTCTRQATARRRSRISRRPSA